MRTLSAMIMRRWSRFDFGAGDLVKLAKAFLRHLSASGFNSFSAKAVILIVSGIGAGIFFSEGCCTGGND